ncbi:phosphotransferase [Planotetraspora kaengkrachanensis]|uniref:Aminoglycoside phosphotransferase domain-containing protein n=1 Tax=Planotetraspora kaengkrachanensis TaxID=575193 RepID=A0A8J3PZR4_9ACTN|nr:phosphotransferase [Planotetraspora kaengkrachanensis]GIG84090.1 hypothetical protein Pka01_72170 [Planotetraspora kaengkrachanensis]
MSPDAPVSAAVSIAADYGVCVTDPVILKDSFNIRVRLRPAPIVARIPTVTTLGRPRPADALAREVAVVSFLAERGAPVVPVSDLLPPGPFERDGYAVTFWTFVEHDRVEQVKPADVGRALADLHAVLRDYPGELPYLGPALEETACLFDQLDSPARSDKGTLVELREELDLLGAELNRWAGPTQAVHGTRTPGTSSPPPMDCCGTTSRRPAPDQRDGTWPACSAQETSKDDMPHGSTVPIRTIRAFSRYYVPEDCRARSGCSRRHGDSLEKRPAPWQPSMTGAGVGLPDD